MFKFFANLWRSNWRNKLMLIFGALIFLCSAIAVTWAVVTRHGDEGFLTAKNGEPLQWRKEELPILCTAHSSVEDKHLAQYNKARKEINDRVGKELIGFCTRWLIAKPFPTKAVGGGGLLLYIGQPKEAAKDGIVVETPWGAHPGGVTQLWEATNTKGKIYGIKIFIDPEYSENYGVWLHELGHGLGLTHDRLRDSIMWPTIQERPGKLSGKDVEALAGAYK